MPLNLDTLDEKKGQIEADVEAASGQALVTTGIWHTTLWATVQAGMSKIMDLMVVKALKDALLSTCNDVALLTANWARWTKTPQRLATSAVLTVAGTGTDAAVLPGGISGRQFVHESGVKFYLTENFTIPAGGVINTTVTAYIPGIDGNIPSGDIFITQTDPNLDNGKLTITGIDTAGVSDESVEKWKAAIQRVLQSPVLSDNYSYYYQTTRQMKRNGVSYGLVAGYPYVDDPGCLELYVESDSDALYGVPTDDQITYADQYFRGTADEDGDGVADNNVRLPLEYLNYKSDGVTPRFNVYKSQPTDFYVVVSGVVGETKQTAVENEIIKYFPTRKPYVKGASTYDTGTLTQSDLRAKVQGALDLSGGGTFGDVVLYVSSTGAGTGEYPLGRGERARIVAAPGAANIVRFE